jgi:hypothetical protein
MQLPVIIILIVFYIILVVIGTKSTTVPSPPVPSPPIPSTLCPVIPSNYILYNPNDSSTISTQSNKIIFVGQTFYTTTELNTFDITFKVNNKSSEPLFITLQLGKNILTSANVLGNDTSPINIIYSSNIEVPPGLNDISISNINFNRILEPLPYGGAGSYIIGFGNESDVEVEFYQLQCETNTPLFLLDNNYNLFNTQSLLTMTLIGKLI